MGSKKQPKENIKEKTASTSGIVSPFSDDDTAVKKFIKAKEDKERKANIILEYPYNAKDNRGNPKATLDNVVTYLTHSPRWSDACEDTELKPLYYDTFFNEIFIDKKPQSDTLMSKVRIEIEQNSGIESVGKDMTWDAADLVSHENETDHAIKVFEDLAEKWDGKERMAHWLHHSIPGTLDDEYHSAIGYSWLLAIAKRQIRPGTPFKYILTLIGPQTKGKAEWVENKIPTPQGIMRFGDLKVDDFVYGRNGSPTKITHTFPQGKRQLYCVSFIDGSSALFDGEHIFSVVDKKRKKYVGKYTTSTGSRSSKFVIDDEPINLTVNEMITNGLSLENGGCPFWRYSIPKHSPIIGDGGSCKSGYAIGLWLGDGTRKEGRITKPYKEVWEKLSELGWEHAFIEGDENTSRSRTVYSLYKLLRGLGISELGSKERNIPEECFGWDIKARKEILKGLLDSDGECSKTGTVLYSSSSKRLINDVVRLARTLGIQVTEPKVKKAMLNGVRYTNSHRISLVVSVEYFTVKHKKERAFIERKNAKRSVISIEPEITDDAMCIVVEAEDSLYLTQDYILTHNSPLFNVLTEPIDEVATKIVIDDTSRPDTVLPLCQGTLIANFDEGASMTKKGNEEIKAFVAKNEDTIRSPYGRKHKTYQRRWVAGMTENNFDALTDVTGNDRYWVVEVNEMVNFAWLEDNREQLLGEAYARAKRGDEFIMPDNKYANELQNRHRNIHPWEERIMNWLLDQQSYFNDPMDFSVKIEDVWAEALELPMSEYRSIKFHEKRDLFNAMKALSFTSKKKRIEGKLTRIWGPQQGTDDSHNNRVSDYVENKDVNEEMSEILRKSEDF